jgi:hypothetical protein
VAGAAALALTLFGTACRDAAPAVSGAAAAKQEIVLWNAVAEWSGRGNAQTESFSGDTGGFRFRWTTSRESPPGTGRFKLTLHSAISGRPLAVAVDTTGVGADTAYVSEDPRTFHVVIESQNVDWTVVVEEPIRGVIDPAARPR